MENSQFSGTLHHSPEQLPICLALIALTSPYLVAPSPKHPPLLTTLSSQHGPTVSLYYKDPDGNMLETQYDVFGDDAEGIRLTTECMEGEAYALNPLGIDYDPEELYERVRREGEEEITAAFRKSRGKGDGLPRTIETLPREFLE